MFYLHSCEEKNKHKIQLHSSLITNVYTNTLLHKQISVHCAKTSKGTFSLYIWDQTVQRPNCAETKLCKPSLFVFNCQKRHLPSFGQVSLKATFEIGNKQVFCFWIWICNWIQNLCMHLNMKQNISYVCSPKGINLEGDFLFAWNQTEFRFDVLSVPQIYCSQSLRQIYWATKPSYRKPSNTKVQQKIMDQKFSARNVCKNCCTAKWCFFETIFFLGIF